MNGWQALQRMARALWRDPAHAFYFTTAAVALAATSSLPPAAHLVLVAAVWWIVAVHEVGHGIVAFATGFGVRSCWALPGFGRTNLRVPEGRRLQHALIGIAGPLAGVAAAWCVARFAATAGLDPATRTWCERIALAGALESLANLLPFGPLDGALALGQVRRWQRERVVEQRLFGMMAGRRPAPAPRPSLTRLVASPASRVEIAPVRVEIAPVGIRPAGFTGTRVPVNARGTAPVPVAAVGAHAEGSAAAVTLRRGARRLAACTPHRAARACGSARRSEVRSTGRWRAAACRGGFSLRA